MRVLIDIKHPAEAHFFGPLIRHLELRGDTVLVTAHYKPDVVELLSALGIKHVKISEAWPTPIGICAVAMVRTLRMLKIARRFRPQIMAARVGIEIGAVGRILGVPVVSFDENEYATAQLLLSRHLANFICTGMGYERALGAKQLRFNALPQLVYTHPARFTPCVAGLQGNGFDPTEPYIVVRLGAWTALHDLGYRGVSEEAALDLIKRLCKYGRVIASRPGGLPPSLLPYAHPVPVDKYLDLLAFAKVYVGEGGSMATEAACLGTPAIWMSPLKWGYLNVLAGKYGLVEQTTDLDEVYESALRWLTSPSLQQKASRARRQLLADSDDPLEFMVAVVDRYALRS